MAMKNQSETMTASGDADGWTCLSMRHPKMRLVCGLAVKGAELEDKPKTHKYAYTLHKYHGLSDCVDAVETNTLVDKWGCFFTNEPIPFDDNCQSISIDLWKERDWL